MTKTWTLLVYVAHEEEWTTSLGVISEMAQATGVGRLNVLVQAQATLTTAVAYRVVGLGEGSAAGGASSGDAPPGLVRVPELSGTVDLATPEALTRFIEWGVRTAGEDDRLALVVWSHGDGSEPGVPSPPHAIILNDGIMMSNEDFHEAVLRAKERTRRLDLIGCDACQMGMLEFAYENRDLASVLVASQGIVDPRGWPYRAILTSLAEKPSMDARELAETIVRRYGEQPLDPVLQHADLSAVDAGKAEPLALRLGELAKALLGRPEDDWSKLGGMILSVFDDTLAGTSYVDLEELARGVAATLPEASDVQKAVADLLAVLDGARFFNFHKGNTAQGLSVFLPQSAPALASYEAVFPFARSHPRWRALLGRILQELK